MEPIIVDLEELLEIPKDLRKSEEIRGYLNNNINNKYEVNDMVRTDSIERYIIIYNKNTHKYYNTGIELDDVMEVFPNKWFGDIFKMIYIDNVGGICLRFSVNKEFRFFFEYRTNIFIKIE
jgi:hypothetical protein